MARLSGFRLFLWATIGVVWALSWRASAAETLRLVIETSAFGPYGLANDKAPGFGVEVLRQVFAAMGQDVSIEGFPVGRSWVMVARGESDGIFPMTRVIRQGQQICSFPEEPLNQERWVLFIRAADIGKLKFTSFDDLVGHDVAVREQVPGSLEKPTASPELWKFLREHNNIVETSGADESLRMLAASRVDYAAVNLGTGMRTIAGMGLGGKLEPLLSRSVFEDGMYLCFSKARVAPAIVDAFSRALKQFKQTEAFQAIYRKYFP